MPYPITRMRRLRVNEHLREMLTEYRVDLNSLIMPFFVCPGKGVRNAITSMPGISQLAIDELIKECEHILKLGIRAVLLFGIPESKDKEGAAGYAPDGIVQRALRELKKHLPELFVITDVCNCEYTTHGHCGPLVDGLVDNDRTISILIKQALSHAAAGADMVAPSDMMDGRIIRIRQALDDAGYINLPIMSYAAKFASAFYGPFREAAGSAPQFGDRRSYQINPANKREALREAEFDIEEGADIVMVKPALSYLDIIRDIKSNYHVPVAAYNVSGEYAMVKAAAMKGFIDGQKVMTEILTSIKRAGADLIITYFAKEAAELWGGRTCHD